MQRDAILSKAKEKRDGAYRKAQLRYEAAAEEIGVRMKVIMKKKQDVPNSAQEALNRELASLDSE